MRWLAACLAGLFACAACAHSPDDAFVSAADRLRPSVVLITGTVARQTEYATGTVVASGAWGSDILTVQHALEGASTLHAIVGNKTRYGAQVAAVDRGLDIALVRIPAHDLPVAELGTSAAIRPGRTIGLLGYPIPDQFNFEGFGLQTSTDQGTLSTIRHEAIEVRLPIVPGESGGPIFLADDGKVIGVAESRFESEQSIGFALPIDAAKQFLHRTDSVHGF